MECFEIVKPLGLQPTAAAQSSATGKSSDLAGPVISWLVFPVSPFRRSP